VGLDSSFAYEFAAKSLETEASSLFSSRTPYAPQEEAASVILQLRLKQILAVVITLATFRRKNEAS